MITNLGKKIEGMEKKNELSPFPIYSTEIINDLKIRKKMITKQGDFNNVPVSYCKTCLSLNIKQPNKKLNVSYCGSCSNMEIDEAHINDWDRMYEEKYGKNFLKGE